MRAYPDSELTQWELAEFYRTTGQYAQAIPEYEECGRLRPGRVAAWKHLARCCWALKRNADAERAYRKALEFAVEEGERLAIEGHLHALAERYEEAVATYRRALDRQPKDTFARHRLAEILRFQMGQPDEAVGQYQAIQKIDPSDVDGWHNAADCYREVGDWEKVVAVLERAADIMPDSAKILRQLAQKLVDTVNQMPRALQLAERAVHLAPQSWQCWKTLGQVYHRLGRLEEADAAYRKAIEVSPNAPEPYRLYASFLHSVGKHERALDALMCAHRLEPDNLLYWLSIADAHLRLGNHKQARVWADQVAQRHPADWDICRFLSGLYLQLGEPDQAVQWAHESVRLAPTQPSAWHRLGLAYLAAAQPAQAIAAFEKVLSLLPTEGVHMMEHIYLNLGRACRQVGDEQKARATFQAGVKAIESWLKAGHNYDSLHIRLTQLRAALGDDGLPVNE